MKVIFLDIDGVMNSNIFYDERYRKIKSKKWFKLSHWIYLFKKLFRIKSRGKSLSDHISPDKYYEYDYQFSRLNSETCPQKWKWLSEFCNENDIKICISSVWKNHFGDRERVLPKRWINALNDLGFKYGTFVGITGDRRNCRGEEIKEWLDMHPEVTDYAILDDDSDMLEEQFSKFHHCDSWFGMSPNHLYRIGRQFNGLSNYSKLSKVLK